MFEGVPGRDQENQKMVPEVSTPMEIQEKFHEENQGQQRGAVQKIVNEQKAEKTF